MTDKTNTVPPMNREDSFECAICLQPCMQPVQLPCSHVFCFLCAKGIAMQSQKCALCRSAIPQDFITKPTLFTKDDCRHHSSSPESKKRYVWYYQGYNGWWQYDARTCAEIEAAFESKMTSVDVLVAGSVYVIDFESLIQYQRHRNSRKRKIKRDLITADKKGVAGLETKTQQTIPLPSSGSDPAASSTSGGGSIFIVDQAQLPELTDGAGRQLPLGADDLNNDDISINSPLLLPNSTPALIRATSDVTNASYQQHIRPSLIRHNTYSHSNPNADNAME